MAFLLMLGLYAKYVPWTMTNITRVDAKRDFLILGHYEVKGQTSAFYTKYLRTNAVWHVFIKQMH